MHLDVKTRSALRRALERAFTGPNQATRLEDQGFEALVNALAQGLGEKVVADLMAAALLRARAAITGAWAPQVQADEAAYQADQRLGYGARARRVRLVVDAAAGWTATRAWALDSLAGNAGPESAAQDLRDEEEAFGLLLDAVEEQGF